MKELYKEFKRNIFNPWYYMTVLMLPVLYLALAINCAAVYLSKGLERFCKYINDRVK